MVRLMLGQNGNAPCLPETRYVLAPDLLDNLPVVTSVIRALLHSLRLVVRSRAPTRNVFNHQSFTNLVASLGIHVLIESLETPVAFQESER
jgi:hypothetical protein